MNAAHELSRAAAISAAEHGARAIASAAHGLWSLSIASALRCVGSALACRAWSGVARQIDARAPIDASGPRCEDATINDPRDPESVEWN